MAVKNALRVNRQTWKITDMLKGSFLSVILLVFVFSSIPYTKFSIGSMIGNWANPSSEPMGSRLYLLGEHIHHYVFGLVLMGLAFFSLASEKQHLNAIMFGFGLVLFLDQLPFVLGMMKFGV